MNNNITICVADYALAADFFLRISSCDAERKYVFVNTLLSSHLKVKKRHESYLVTKLTNPKDGINSLPDNRLRETALGILSREKSLRLASSLYIKIVNIIEKYKKSRVTIMTWNGDNIIGAVMRELKKEYKDISLIFFELSNLKGKLLVDNMGVNASSSVYASLDKIDEMPPVDPDIHQKWVKEFYESKENPGSIPQAVKGKEINIRHIIDFIYTNTVGYKLYTNNAILNRIKGKKNNVVKFDNEKNLPERFIFFPMQVSTDTQIVLNSDVDNVGVLKYLVDQEALPIVTKPHPAELNFDYIYKIKNENKDKIFITNTNTYELIKKSEKVYTINSTVGMEAMLYDKNVSFMGRSIYSKMNNEQLKKFIHLYLIDIDFFDCRKNISKNVIDKIYSRA
ncbi:TPA: hypothetical protein ACNMO8_004866 [Klebsiella pneumoniae]